MPEEWVCGEKPSHIGIIVACTAVVGASFRIELAAREEIRIADGRVAWGIHLPEGAVGITLGQRAV